MGAGVLTYEGGCVAENVTLTNRALFRMYVALKVLGNRRMATVGADLKVGRLLRVLAPLVEPLDELKQRAVKGVLMAGAEKAAVSGLALSLVNLTSAEVQSAIDNDTVDAALPLQFALKEADLPKRKKDDEEADPDATGIGALVADLGPLFLLPD